MLAKDGITGSYGIRLGEILDKDGKQRVYVTHASPAPVLAGCADGPTGYHDASLKMLLLGDDRSYALSDFVNVKRNGKIAMELPEGVEDGDFGP